ncbi:hypothetical protein [Formosa sp. S-31]|uniref:hypothetical protein n=1 Tax=Formosa sp. S-31 TaxID=2790949 RepID=UPI003EBD5038
MTKQIKTSNTQDTFSLRIVKLNNYIIKSKWMFGVYAGFIVLLENETMKNKSIENKLIITGIFIGVILLAYATVNFEQNLIEINNAKNTGKTDNDPVDISDNKYKKALFLFECNFLWIFFLGISFLCFLWFSFF